jgi:hypothetical protein
MVWRRSSYSGNNGNCVEVEWRKSSHSGDNGNCVEVASSERAVAIRDSKAPHTGPLQIPPASWRAFLGHLAP